jgi:Arc/MetJ-type ribon-helix-helix transcriptional regulator
MQRVTVYLPREYVDWAREAGRGNVAEGLRRLLEELDQRQGTEAAARPAN